MLCVWTPGQAEPPLVLLQSPHLKPPPTPPRQPQASAACEWVLAISFTLFFLTYTREFRRIVLHTYVRMNAFGGYAPINDHPGGSMEIL